MTASLLTFGHGNASAERIVELLRSAGVALLVDVRTAPGSRHNPHVARAELVNWLPENGIAYRHERRLGGLRPGWDDSPDTALRNSALAGYAAHMRTQEFGVAIDDLLVEAASVATTVMCAESSWTRCHRQLVADFVELARGVPVEHLGHDGARQRHPVSDVVRTREDGLLVYDGGQQELFG